MGCPPIDKYIISTQAAGRRRAGGGQAAGRRRAGGGQAAGRRRASGGQAAGKRRASGGQAQAIIIIIACDNINMIIAIFSS